MPRETSVSAISTASADSSQRSEEEDDFKSVSEGESPHTEQHSDDGHPGSSQPLGKRISQDEVTITAPRPQDNTEHTPAKQIVDDQTTDQQHSLEKFPDPKEADEKTLSPPEHEDHGSLEPPPPYVSNTDKPKHKHARNESIASKRFSAAMAANKQAMAPTEASGVSQYSHQHISEEPKSPSATLAEEDEWQTMPAYAEYDMWDDDGKLIARGVGETEDEAAGYSGIGGAGRGYTRVQIDEDAQSATSMDENTAYLFKDPGTNAIDDDEEGRDAMAQMQTTKNLLSDTQKIAYVGAVRLALAAMLKDINDIERSKKAKKDVDIAAESLRMWSQKVMIALYSHIELDPAEQMMIEQLADHGLEASDLTPTLMVNARVKNPNAGNEENDGEDKSGKSDKIPDGSVPSRPSLSSSQGDEPPPYEAHRDSGEDLPEVRTPSQMPSSDRIDIDIRWTILCDLFLILISDSQYDARSRCLLERVGEYLQVPWLDICRFEKRVTDALEMEEAQQKEDLDEEENVKNREKRARKKRLIYMGLATVGGGLIIGLSAGALAPVIGAGLAAGFTTIGVTGTGGFLAGAGGAAIIGTTFTVAGGGIGVRAASRRTGAVKTFEYRPLHNNKRVNLIVTCAGWVNGKVDDVRLPFSTVDPIMGDIYSIHWEPEMMRSMGDTINILATEALTQTIQQVIGSTLLMSLMAALQLPLVLTKLAYLIDNPWSVSLARADAAGLILADSLIDRNLGSRPITLVGFSVGARMIFSCLKELARRGAVGIVQNVYVFGSPVVVSKDDYLRIRATVAGRFVNGYATNDWILGYLFRATGGGIMRVAGLAQVPVPGIENLDITQFVKGHMAYRTAMPRLLREVGWAVTSDEFSEIEDPDPENFEQRQRELINEIEEARKELEKKPPKKKWGWFSSKKRGEKKEWETYDEGIKAAANEEGRVSAEGQPTEFDVEAIRREAINIASQGVDVNRLESTAPTNLTVNTNVEEHDDTLKPAPLLRPKKSYDNSPKTLNANRAAPVGSKSYEEYNEEAEQYIKPGEESISMSFEPSYSSNSRDHTQPISNNPFAPPIRKKSHDAAMASRKVSQQSAFPGTTVTQTVTTPLANPSRNPWASRNDNADDEIDGKETEMTMTFE